MSPIVLSLQTPASKGGSSVIERYMRVELPSDADAGDVRKALTRLLADWRNRGDESTIVARPKGQFITSRGKPDLADEPGDDT